MSQLTTSLKYAIKRMNKIFEDFEESKITEIGLLDYLDDEVAKFTKKSITWSQLGEKDYLSDRFSADDRILMLYADVLFSKDDWRNSI